MTIAHRPNFKSAAIAFIFALATDVCRLEAGDAPSFIEAVSQESRDGPSKDCDLLCDAHLE